MIDVAVKPVSLNDVKPFLLNIHYHKRMCPISFKFGAFKRDEILGVVTYGCPASAPLRKGVAGERFASNVLELNRLCLKRNIKNLASYLVSKSLKQIPGNWIVVSYADSAQNHVGYVYQASNFGYYGLSAKRTDWKLKGKEHLHGQTIADEFRGPNRAERMRKKYGDDFYLAPRPRKHRYIKIIGSRAFKKEAENAIRYTKQPYPKEAAI